VKLTYKQKFNKKYGFPKDKAHSLRDIARITGRSYKGIKQIFEKGEGAYYSNPQSVRKNVKSPQQWAYARVYSAVMGGKASKVDKKELNLKKKKMAVKYSKQRDFGAKGRKSRKLGNKMFTKVSTSKFKRIAKARAEMIRGRGKLARVVKETVNGKVVYGVYSHGKRGSIGYRKRLKRLTR
tara:strand:+ start:208 stop:750 length:543 start_codon:yes stop_codon:yes gene_type:complete